MSKKPICKWESTCDDDCRRPYGNCPENCQNYKPYVSIEELEKENDQLKQDKEAYLYMIQDTLKRNLIKENLELKKELKKEKDLNAQIKKRLVEVSCDCTPEKKENCVMFPEYCEGKHTTVIDLLSLVSDGLNETLLKQKDEQIKDLCESLDIMNNRESELLEQIEKMKCCENCSKYRKGKCTEDTMFYARTLKMCKDWELADISQN